MSTPIRDKRQDDRRYDRLSQLFHWSTALAVGVAFVLGPEGFGRMMRNGGDPATHSDIVWHESLGLLVFALTAVRLVWMALRPAAPQFAMPSWMHRLGQIGHFALWALMLALPVTALLALGTEGHPLTLLGGVRVNQLPVTAESAVASLADWGEVHGLLGDAIMVLAGVHAVAALVHHFMLKDGVLAAMWPWVRTR